MKLSVFTLTGHQQFIEVSDDDSLSKVRQVLEKRENVKPEHQILHCNNTTLDGDEPISSYNLTEDSLIFMTFPPLLTTYHDFGFQTQTWDMYDMINILDMDNTRKTELDDTYLRRPQHKYIILAYCPFSGKLFMLLTNRTKLTYKDVVDFIDRDLSYSSKIGDENPMLDVTILNKIIYEPTHYNYSSESQPTSNVKYTMFLNKLQYPMLNHPILLQDVVYNSYNIAFATFYSI